MRTGELLCCVTYIFRRVKLVSAYLTFKKTIYIPKSLKCVLKFDYKWLFQELSGFGAWVSKLYPYFWKSFKKMKKTAGPPTYPFLLEVQLNCVWLD